MDRGKMQQIAAPAGPTPAQLAAFQTSHGGGFDPNSSMDRGKMQQLVGGRKWAAWCNGSAV